MKRKELQDSVSHQRKIHGSLPRRSLIRRKQEIKGLGAQCLMELCALLSILEQKEEDTQARLPGRGRARAR